MKNREKSTFREILPLRLIILSKMLLQTSRTSPDTFYELLVERECETCLFTIWIYFGKTNPHSVGKPDWAKVCQSVVKDTLTDWLIRSQRWERKNVQLKTSQPNSLQILISIFCTLIIISFLITIKGRPKDLTRLEYNSKRPTPLSARHKGLLGFFIQEK